jgi:hypothetical protein
MRIAAPIAGWWRQPACTAPSIYLNDATLAGAFVARWCAGYKVESADGVFQIREDPPTPRLLPGLHETP